MNFAVTGVGGYIAPRHLQAIKDIGGEAVAALDPFDSVGILDRYFFDTRYFSNSEDFWKYIEGKVDYVSVCTPDYVHTEHCLAAMNAGADVICEKPLVMHPRELDILGRAERVNGRKVCTVLQLREHPAILKLKQEYNQKKTDVEVTYITPRGDWFLNSWRGDPTKQAGLASTIGIHLFDFLIWVFGEVKDYEISLSSPTKIAGSLTLDRAEVKWLLSIDKGDLEGGLKENNDAHRVIKVNGEKLEFSTGFKDLHTTVYRRIIDGKGWGIEDVRPAIELVSRF